MKNFPQNKYHFYTATKVTGEPYKVVAVSTYAGKRVRGKAKCNPEDAFDMEKGKELAAARCNARIAAKRAAAAHSKYVDAFSKFKDAEDYLIKMNEYKFDTQTALAEANKKVNDLLDNM